MVSSILTGGTSKQSVRTFIVKGLNIQVSISKEVGTFLVFKKERTGLNGKYYKGKIGN